MIRNALPADAPGICGIYNHYVEHSVITFEETPVEPKEMEGRIKEVQEKYPWLVWEEKNEILGYAYASSWKGRCAYRFSAEATVYVRQDIRGKGVGKALYGTLLEELSRRSVHMVLAGIALPNEESQALHERFGFKKAAHFSEVGFKFGRWVDVGYWEKRLISPASDRCADGEEPRPC
jgi:L-amino acid N-acyltransferase YncA